jgi:UDP:flavonoid glycosyltransferase YjiC (YdhE family)
MTRLAIIALGSRGDVQPFVALGLGLQAAGHTVKIAAAADYAELVAYYGLAFHSLVGQISTLLDPAMVEQFLERAQNPLRAARNFVRQTNPIIDRLMHDCWAACQDAEGLIVSTLGMYCGVHLAEKLNITCIVAHLHPFTPFSSDQHMFFPPLPRGVPLRSSYNWLTHALANHGFWQVLRRPLNRSRQGLLDMEPLSPLALWGRLRGYRPPTLYGYSAIVAPPADGQAHRQITGYWFLDRAPRWQPPAELATFLSSGPAPIYIGFGSMMLGRDGDRITALIADALGRVGQRGILYRGWGELGRMRLPPSILAVDSIPHDWLFPQVRAVVHHGGAGVTAQALRAGVPAIVVPFLGDQHFWADRLAELGTGPEPIPRAQLSSARLAQAITNVIHSNSMRERAAEVGLRLKAERGVAGAVALIDSYLETGDGTRYGTTTSGENSRTRMVSPPATGVERGTGSAAQGGTRSDRAHDRRV